MSGKILYVTCHRYFAGDGCVGCVWNSEDCDHAGFVPQGQEPPPLTNPPLPSKVRQVLTAGRGGGSGRSIVTVQTPSDVEANI